MQETQQTEHPELYKANDVLKNLLKFDASSPSFPGQEKQMALENIVDRLESIQLTPQDTSNLIFFYQHVPAAVTDLFCEQVVNHPPAEDEAPAKWGSVVDTEEKAEPRQNFDLKWKHCVIDIPLLTYNFLFNQNGIRREEFKHFRPDLVFSAALLHDLTRFEQLDKTNSWNDSYFEHGDAAEAKILEARSLYDQFSVTEVNAIAKAAKYHNKLAIDRDDPEFGNNPESLELTKLMRDIDKSAILLGFDGIYNLKKQIEQHDKYEHGKINPKAWGSFMQDQVIRNEDADTVSSQWIYYLAWLNDLSYKHSKELFFNVIVPVLMTYLVQEKEAGYVSDEEMKTVGEKLNQHVMRLASK